MKKAILGITLMATTLSTTAITSEDLWLQGSVGKLFGILETPESITKDTKYPLVIVCHGFSGNCQSDLMTEVANAITQQGMATLRFDFNGHGKSEGLFQNMTVMNEIEDLKDVIKWARQQPWVENISLLGHSQGGVVVSMVSGELGAKEIKCEVLMSAAAVLKDDALRGVTMGAQFNPWDFKGDYIDTPQAPEVPSVKLGKAYVETAIRLPIYETARNYTGPTLIVHGTHDMLVPYTYSERYHDEIKGSELHLVPDENHMYTETLQKTSTYVADWLHRQLIGK